MSEQPDTRIVAPIDWPPYTPNKHSDRAVDSLMWAYALLGEPDTASREIRPGVWAHTFVPSVPKMPDPASSVIRTVSTSFGTVTFWYEKPLSRKWQARAKWLRLLQMSKRARKQAGRTRG